MLMLALAIPTWMAAASYYISPTGNDSNDGKDDVFPFATLGAALKVVAPGDTVYILPGTYQVSEAEIMKEESSGPYKIVFDLSKSGEPGKPICYIGVPDEKTGQCPVFDLSEVRPAYRVTAFLVSGQFMVLKNFEVVGVQVNRTDHTQSENFRITNGSYNTFENIACHDGMGIGFYLTRNSSHNLFINCDGYNNYDPIGGSDVGDTNGGNNDGFGCHVNEGQTGNVFIGCRAWNNADDGFDLINCYSPVEILYSIAYRNGYDAENTGRGDGNGFKAGGFGMGSSVSLPADGAPKHRVEYCIASNNRANGFYSNHHLGGVCFSCNTAYRNNNFNYNFVNRKGSSLGEAIDVNGYGHVIAKNLSMVANGKENHVAYLNGGDGKNSIVDNSFRWVSKNSGGWAYTDYGTSIFENVRVADLMLKRRADGMLADSTLAVFRLKTDIGIGCTFEDYEQTIAALRLTTGAQTENVPTAIRTVKTGATKDDGPFYDLQGRRVAIPGKGLYIRNGKKIIIR